MIDRGTFVGMAASAVFGQVLENDPGIEVRQVEIRRPDTAMPAYYAQPRGARPNTPGVVVVMHVWGVDANIREIVRRLAKAGFAAIAPDLYARFGAPSGDNETDYTKFVPFAKRLQTAQVDGDLRAAALYLTTAHPQGKVAVMGFCMGGGIALRQAIDNDDVFSADAVFYGKVEGIDPTKIRMPLLGSYGEKDTGIPADSVRAFRKVLRAPSDVIVYPTAGHAFMDDTRSSYVEPAAADAWRRLIAFLTKYLKT